MMTSTETQVVTAAHQLASALANLPPGESVAWLGYALTKLEKAQGESVVKDLRTLLDDRLIAGEW